MSKKLRLYVWDGVLEDYTSGIAFALASSPEEAFQMVAKGFPGVTGRGQYGQNGPTKIDGVEPVAYDSPVGFAIWGGG